MKKLLKVSFLLIVLCFAVPVYADGDMTTGNKNCTQNCGGLFGGINQPATTTNDKKQNESTIENVYLWIYQQISKFID
jgi:hypothetical protein